MRLAKHLQKATVDFVEYIDSAVHLSDRSLLTFLLDAVWQLTYLLTAYIGHRYWNPSRQLCNKIIQYTHVAKASTLP